MLTDQQSLILCALMAIGIFVGGILGILDNFLMLTALTLMFSAIIINLFFWKHPKENVNKDDKS